MGEESETESDGSDGVPWAQKLQQMMNKWRNKTAGVGRWALPNLVDVTQDPSFFPIEEEPSPTKKKKKKKKKGKKKGKGKSEKSEASPTWEPAAESAAPSPAKKKKKKTPRKKKKKDLPTHPDGTIDFGRPKTEEFGRRRIERIRWFHGEHGLPIGQ